ncbi:MAG: hypothetical protein WB586_26570 [Chthoniobacterales bacterium]
MRSTLYPARHNHLRGGQPGVDEGGEQPAAHVDFEACPLESVNDPADAFAKLRSLRFATGQRHSHFLHGDDPARIKISAQPSQSYGRIGYVHQNEPADYRVELLVQIERIELSDVKAHPI